MTDSKTPAEVLTALADACSESSNLWQKDGKTRLYLDGGQYITVDRDGDLIGEGGKLSRVQARLVWGPWEKAAKAIGRSVYC